MTNQRIVLIDDSDADILLLKMCLDEIAPDHQLTVLKDGAAALRFCKAEREQTGVAVVFERKVALRNIS
jgi:CheY-like chemotaxis protein